MTLGVISVHSLTLQSVINPGCNVRKQFKQMYNSSGTYSNFQVTDRVKQHIQEINPRKPGSVGWLYTGDPHPFTLQHDSV